MGIDQISKSHVSRICADLDELVEAWRNRPLDAGPYTFVWIDALALKVRQGGRICNVATLVATGVNANGHREILGLETGSLEDGAVWTAFLRGLVARGLHGIKLVISDAHEGLKNAIAAVLDGASWQRCRTHFMRITRPSGVRSRGCGQVVVRRRCSWRASATRSWRAASLTQPCCSASARRAVTSTSWSRRTSPNSGAGWKLSHCSQMLA